MITELAGFCGVDSGQLILVDPCYAFLDDYEGRETNPSGGNYDAICRVSTSKAFGGASLPGNGYTGSVGVVTSTGYGDGNYPVFVDINEDGRVVSMRVYFNGVPHDDYVVMMNDEENKGYLNGDPINREKLGGF